MFAAEHVLLVVEIVSPGSGSEDRWVKPGEYVNAGVFGPGDRIRSVVLGWVDIPVDQLLSPS